MKYSMPVLALFVSVRPGSKSTFILYPNAVLSYDTCQPYFTWLVIYFFMAYVQYLTYNVAHLVVWTSKNVKRGLEVY